MNRGINFVYERQKKLTQSQLLDRQYFRWASIGLLVTAGLFLIVFGVRLVFFFQLKGITDKQVTARAAIQSQEEVEKEYTIFAHKLKQLTVLYAKRKNKQDALVFFSDLFGSAAVVSGIDYSADESDVLAFTIQTKSVFALDQVFGILARPDVVEVYPSIKKSDMRRVDDGSYFLKLTLNLAQSAAASDAQPADAQQSAGAQP